jgi:hypothetical protein
LAKRFVNFAKNLSRFGKGTSQSLPHADCLASLPRKYESAIHACASKL